MKKTASPDSVSVVLVEPHKGGNIGAVARAMKNMGLEHLKLVAPLEQVTEECRMMAGKAIDLVTSARVYPSLDDAVSQDHLVVGTTSLRKREQSQPIHTPREIAPVILKHAASERVALVFGPERRGLSDSQLARCQYLVSIPSNPEHPVLNLSQAVLILTYEIFIGNPVTGEHALELATDEEREQMFRSMEEVLVQIGFLSSGNPEHIMNSVRRFLGRADLSPRDLQILRGIMSQMQWYAEEGYKLPGEKIKKV
ncbi:MAG: RNA methyltransferase [Acidobacteriota bacterium]